MSNLPPKAEAHATRAATSFGIAVGALSTVWVEWYIAMAVAVALVVYHFVRAVFAD